MHGAPRNVRLENWQGNDPNQERDKDLLFVHRFAWHNSFMFQELLWNPAYLKTDISGAFKFTSGIVCDYAFYQRFAEFSNAIKRSMQRDLDYTGIRLGDWRYQKHDEYSCYLEWDAYYDYREIKHRFDQACNLLQDPRPLMGSVLPISGLPGIVASYSCSELLFENELFKLCPHNGHKDRQSFPIVYFLRHSNIPAVCNWVTSMLHCLPEDFGGKESERHDNLTCSLHFAMQWEWRSGPCIRTRCFYRNSCSCSWPLPGRLTLKDLICSY